MYAYLSILKVLSYSLPYLNSVSFYISLVSRITFLAQSLINLQLKLTNLRNSQIFLTIISVCYNLITLIFIRLILTLFLPTINPRNLTSSLYYLYFLCLSYRSAYFKYSSTSITCLIYSSSILEYTRILSKYTTTVLLRYTLRILLINSQYIASVFVRLNSITKYLYSLYYILNTIFYSLPFFIQIRLYAPFKSSAVKYQASIS